MTPETRTPRSKRRIGILHNCKFLSEVFDQTKHIQHYPPNLENQYFPLERTEEITIRIKEPHKKKH